MRRDNQLHRAAEIAFNNELQLLAWYRRRACWKLGFTFPHPVDITSSPYGIHK